MNNKLKSLFKSENGRFNIINLFFLFGSITAIGLIAFMLIKGPVRQIIENFTEEEATFDHKAFNTWTEVENEVQIPILMYHAIHWMDESEAANANLIVDPETFESHIKRLKDEGYYFMNAEEVHYALTENKLPQEKVVWLTFDDGNADFYSEAYPILTKYNAKATNNIITGFTQDGIGLTLDQMKEMKDNGMEFQSHTVTHPDLSVSSETSQETELTASLEYLNAELDQTTIAIAYPSGRYSDFTTQLAEQSYKLAVTTNEGLASLSDGLLALDRVRILPTTTADSLIYTLETYATSTEIEEGNDESDEQDTFDNLDDENNLNRRSRE